MTIKELENYVLILEQRVEDKVQEVETKVKSRSRPWWILAVAAVVLFVVLWFTVLRKQPESEALKALKEQQKKLDELSNQQKQQAEENRLRDSTLQADFKRNSAERSQSVSNYKKQSNDKINRIPDYH
jgi:membrane-associated HD superfamily phosphohydrolase